MARKRMVAPEIWGNLEFVRQTSMGRLLFIGMFSNADDFGRVKGDPLWLKVNIFPADDINSESILNLCRSLIQTSMVKPYLVEDEQFYYLPAFCKVNTGFKKFAPKYPCPPAQYNPEFDSKSEPEPVESEPDSELTLDFGGMVPDQVVPKKVSEDLKQGESEGKTLTTQEGSDRPVHGIREEIQDEDEIRHILLDAQAHAQASGYDNPFGSSTGYYHMFEDLMRVWTHFKGVEAHNLRSNYLAHLIKLYDTEGGKAVATVASQILTERGPADIETVNFLVKIMWEDPERFTQLKEDLGEQ